MDSYPTWEQQVGRRTPAVNPLLTRMVGILVPCLRSLAGGYYLITADFSPAVPLECLLKTQGICLLVAWLWHRVVHPAVLCQCSSAPGTCDFRPPRPCRRWLLSSLILPLGSFLEQLTRHPAGIPCLLASVWRALAQLAKTAPEDHNDAVLLR